MSQSQTVLKGIAWNHTRGFVPMVAVAQRFEELHPEVAIRWEKRSLQEFADASMAELTARFDLIVMDHPHTALAATEGLLLPMEDWLETGFLADQAAHSVGASHASYCFAGRQWTLATDAAAPIATWRPDLMERQGLSRPETWEQLLELARAGLVSFSAFPVDVLMHSYMFCEAQGVVPFAEPDQVAPGEILEAALEALRVLASLCDPFCLEANPIRIAERMASPSSKAAYCPFGYGYSNYSRPGYAAHLLQAGGLVTWAGRRLRSTLGGAGVAVSSRTAFPRLAMDFAAFAAAPDTQRGVYFHSGGQPGHRNAWTDDLVNSLSSDFFRDTLGTLDESIVRPQFPGYMAFQDAASPVAHQGVTGQMSVKAAAAELNRLCHHSRQ